MFHFQPGRGDNPINHHFVRIYLGGGFMFFFIFDPNPWGFMIHFGDFYIFFIHGIGEKPTKLSTVTTLGFQPPKPRFGMTGPPKTYPKHR